jgi:integrase
METKQEIKKELLEKRKLTEGTLKTYTSLLSSLFNKLHGENNDFSILKNDKKTLPIINEMTSKQSKKTLLSALYVLTGNPKYSELMKDVASQVSEDYSKGLIKDSRKENQLELTQDKLREKYNLYYKLLLNTPSLENYINYFIVAVTSGQVGIPPRRNLDYTEMMIRNLPKDKSEINYIEKGNFVFNRFKTAKFVSPEDRQVKIPNELLKMIKKYMKDFNYDYLLVRDDGSKFTSSALTKRLNKIYGRHIGVSALRSINLQQDKETIDALKVLEEKTKQMGTSVDAAKNFYIKKSSDTN